jgi:dTDP-4-dehydrorhamnose reductase
MKVLITGAGGQLGYELARTTPEDVNCLLLDRPLLDITDAEAVMRMLINERPAVVINAAAYTAVDKAEIERERAYAINAQGADNLAQAAAEANAYLVHLSTDFVFDGQAARPYVPQAEPAPLSVYGASKLEGEFRVRAVLGNQALILRTAWVYSCHGHNFVKTMLRLMREREELSVVADQIGTPTWANALAQSIWRAIARRTTGVHHWTDAGVASWYDFAIAIATKAHILGLIERLPRVRPIRTEDYPTPAKRPFYSVLDKTSTYDALEQMPMHWTESLDLMLRELATSKNTAEEGAHA